MSNQNYRVVQWFLIIRARKNEAMRTGPTLGANMEKPFNQYGGSREIIHYKNISTAETHNR